MMENMGKTNLLMLIPWMELGGADRFNLSILEKIDKNAFSVFVVCTHPGENRWRDRFEKEAEAVFVLPQTHKPEEYADFILELIKTRNIHAVFLSNSYYGYYLLPLIKCTFPQVAVIDYVHMEEWYWRKGGYARLSGRSECCVDRTLVCNHRTEQVLIDAFSRDPGTVETLYIGVDQDKFDCRKIPYGEIRAQYNIKDNCKVVLFPCRIHPQKRPFLMLEIAKDVIEREKNVCFLVAGDGPQLQELKNQIRRQGLEKWFRCPGEIARMEKAYRDSDVTLICSLKEGLSLTAYESCAMETPVISADVGGQGELIDDTVGRLIPLGQAETDIDSREYSREEIRAYSDAILDILADREGYAALCRNCREKIDARFSDEIMIRRLEQILTETIARVRQTPRQVLPGSAMGLAKNYLEVYLEFEEASNPRNRGEDVNLELKRIANSRLGRLLIKVIMKLRINKLF